MSDRAKNNYDVFISYAEADSAWWVEGYLLDALTQVGVRCHSEAAFALGVPRLLEFERAIQRSRRTLLVLSPAYLSDESNQFIDLLAQSYGLEMTTWPVIPLILRPVRLPLRLGMLTSLDATDSQRWSEVIERLCHELQRPVPEPPSRLACPYPGMVPFSARDARFFFGREAEIDQMLQYLRHQRFLLVIGDSGSGKSSLISAGFLPKLNESTFFPPGYWLVRTMRPGSQPLQTLSQVVSADLAQPAQAISDLLVAHPPAQRLLLVIDQFEELFTQASRPDQSQFIAALQALRVTESCALVIALRGDFFYTDLTGSDLWPIAPSERLEIAPLRGAALRDAIVKPASREGVYLEPGLIELLLTDAADERGVLPLVQETMVQLWDRMERRLIPLRAYEQLGGGGRSGLAGALVTKADATLAALAHRSPRHETIARRIFLRLVQFGEGRPDTRRQQPESALRSWEDDPQVFDQTLHHLAENRLLTLSGEEEDKDRKVDIAHEALFTEWPALEERVREWRKPEQMRRRLEDWATNWVNRERDPKALLNPSELSHAEEWLSNPAACELGYSEALLALVQASRAAIEEAEQEKEVARQRELEQERALATEQRRRAETERKARGRQRNLSISLAVSLAVAVIAAVLFFQQMQDAIQQQQIALSRELAASALSQLSVDPERSVLLATEAAGIWPSAEAENALRQSLLESDVRTVMRGHAARVNSATFSPNGKLVVTASSDGTARVWEAATGRMILELRGHTRAVISAAFSPDGQWVATAGEDGMVRVYEVATGRIQVELPKHPSAVTRAVFTPDGLFVVTESDQVRIWEVATGNLIDEFDGAVSADGKIVAKSVATWEGPRTKIWQVAPLQLISELKGSIGYAVTFSPDGNLLVTDEGDGLRLWEVKTGTLIRVLGNQSDVMVQFSPDSNLIVTPGGIGTASVGEVKTGRLIAVLRGGVGTVTSAAFSPNGKFVVAACAEQILWGSAGGGRWGTGDKTVRVWEVTTQSIVAELRGHDGDVTSVAFSPDGKFILTASEDKTARLWEPMARQSVLRGHTDDVISAAFSPDGKWIVTASMDKTARVWDFAAALDIDRAPVKPLAVLRGHTAGVTSAAFSSDSRFVVTASANPGKWGREDTTGGDYTARLWEASTGQMRAELRGHTSWINSARFSPDGNLVVTASDDKTVRVWEAATGKCITELHGHTDKVNNATFSLDGKLIVTASEDKTARVWEAHTGTTIAVFSEHTTFVNIAAFSPDGKFVVTAGGRIIARHGDTGYGGTAVQVWESATGRQVAALDQHTGKVVSVAFSPDGKFILTGSLDRTARIWEANTWRSLNELRGHMSWVRQARFSPDGKFAVTASDDNTVRIWEAMTGRTLYILHEHTAKVYDAAFSPSGKWVISASGDNSAVIFACHVCGTTQDLLALANTRVTRPLTCEERQRFLHETAPCLTPTSSLTVNQ